MKRIIGILSLTLLLCCQKKNIAPPETLLERDVMVAILLDIAILQAVESNNAQFLSQKGITIPEFIYKKYNIDSLQFAQNSRYYASDPHDYKKMYAEVYEKINQKSEGINQQSVEKTGKAIAPSDARVLE